jgi:hypothetical protein
MKKAAIVFAMMFVFWCSAGAALADYYRQQFEDMDTNQDDFVTWQEYRYYFLHARQDGFRELDENNDGKIGLYEWLEFQAKQDPTYEVERNYRYGGKYVHWYPCSHYSWYYHRHGCWYDHWPGYPHMFGFGIGIYIHD